MFITLFFPAKLFAHAEESAFVTVNGELAQTNPYYQGTSSINVPQDILKTQFLPQEQITFAIDSSKLSIPQSIISQGEFTWLFFEGENFLSQIGEVEKGTTITHTFTKPGSYLVNVYFTYENDPQLFDTIQLNVLPYKGYVSPSAHVNINQVENTVYYLSNPNVDPKNSVLSSFWDLGDGTIIKGTNQSLPHTYEVSSFVTYVYHRVIDENNLSTDVGFQVQGINGKISFVPFPNDTTTPFTLSITKAPYTFIPDSILVWSVSLGIVLLLIFIFLKYKIRVVR